MSLTLSIFKVSEMKLAEIEFIRACLPESRTLFHYYKDRYAVMLLQWAGIDTIAGIKRSRYAPLLSRPPVREAVKLCGDGRWVPGRVREPWEESYAFRLTLGQWPMTEKVGAWQQTSRRQHNLVLQINFSGMHNSVFRTVFGDADWIFGTQAHPVSNRETTLSWVRLEIDLDASEALIEEIQNDWLRSAYSERRYHPHFVVTDENGRIAESMIRRRRVIPFDRYRSYVEQTLHPYRRLWDELTLSAALWFLRDELGIRRIFYHTVESGRFYKSMEKSHPPRSLYSTLPERFCFERTDEMPGFLHNLRHLRRQRKNGAPQLFFLKLG
jgi:hypothetical protein